MINYNVILKFWFREQHKHWWFEEHTDFDHKIKSKFFKYYKNIKDARWIASDCTSEQQLLSKILFLNVLPKKIFRNTCLSFINDQIAKTFTQYMICGGIDQRLSSEQRIFIYLPLANSENLNDLDCAYYLYKKINDLLIVQKILQQIQTNKNLIKQYGRLPYRNIVLGRKSSIEEEFFLLNNYKNSTERIKLDLF